MAPMAAGGWPVAAATSRPASWVCRLKVGKSKRKLLPSASAPVMRAVLPSIVALTLRSASAFIVPETPPLAEAAPILPLRSFGRPA